MVFCDSNHNVCKVLSCSLYQYFIPFLGQATFRCVFMYILFFHSSVDHLFLSWLYSAAANIHMQVLCRHVFYSLEGIPRSQTSGSNGNFLTEELPACFPKQQYHFTFPPVVCKGSISLLVFV